MASPLRRELHLRHQRLSGVEELLLATFPTLWERLNGLVANGTILSVREVYNELQGFNDEVFIQEWAKRRRRLFGTPSSLELSIVQEILAMPHFQTLISQRAILRGSPVADPFVIAAAKARGATVVTQETYRPRAARIPNVCEHFQVRCINLETFMAEQGWTF